MSRTTSIPERRARSSARALSLPPDHMRAYGLPVMAAGKSRQDLFHDHVGIIHGRRFLEEEKGHRNRAHQKVHEPAWIRVHAQLSRLDRSLDAGFQRSPIAEESPPYLCLVTALQHQPEHPLA